MRRERKGYWPSEMGLGVLCVACISLGVILGQGLPAIWPAAPKIELGSLAEFMAAAGTIAATWVAVRTAKQSHDLSRAENEERRSKDAAHDRVIAWRLHQHVTDIRLRAEHAIASLELIKMAPQDGRSVVLGNAKDFAQGLLRTAQPEDRKSVV